MSKVAETKGRERIQVVNVFIEVKLSKIPKVKVLYTIQCCIILKDIFITYIHIFLYVKKYHFKTKMRNNYMKCFCLQVKTQLFFTSSKMCVFKKYTCFSNQCFLALLLLF